MHFLQREPWPRLNGAKKKCIVFLKKIHCVMRHFRSREITATRVSKDNELVKPVVTCFPPGNQRFSHK